MPQHKLSIDKLTLILESIPDVEIYPSSLRESDSLAFAMIRKRGVRFFIMAGNDISPGYDSFSGNISYEDGVAIRFCPLTHSNAVILRQVFPFTKPILLGTSDSFGYGDRLGNAGPAHVRSVKGSGFRPVVAQQSIRELTRTSRTAEEVLNAASWAVFQEGFEDGFGADGDHLKTTDDIDLMVKAGYTMFTIDPSDHVDNSYSDLSHEQRRKAFDALPWSDLEDSPSNCLQRYTEEPIRLSSGYELSVSEEDLLNGMIKYGRVIRHSMMMYHHLRETHPDHEAELELSVDETPNPTTLFEHYLIASELQRLRIPLVSLAPRFSGDFEKGIDFKGDIHQFSEEYRQHIAISRQFGGYKLSIHSGSDKFTVYKAIGALDEGTVHVKTAGTSYLEALRTVAVCDPDLFRRILSFSIERFEEDRKSYHISADTERVQDPFDKDDSDLPDYLNDDDARQVLHVAYGSVLQSNQLKNEMMNVLEENESIHEQFLMEHFQRHLKPFKKLQPTHGSY